MYSRSPSPFRLLQRGGSLLTGGSLSQGGHAAPRKVALFKVALFKVARSKVILCAIAIVAVLTSLQLWLTSTPVQAATLPPGFTDELVTEVVRPTDIAWTPDGRLIMLQQTGVVTIRTVTGESTVALRLGNHGLICSNDERGLLGVAVDPDFASNRYIYLYYTHKTGSTCGRGNITVEGVPENRLVRVVLDDNNTIDINTQTILIDHIPSPHGTHNAGDLEFGADGYLYVSVGDGSCNYLDLRLCGRNNPAARDQNILLGKILRITRDGGIPPTNPWVGPDSVPCALLPYTLTDPGKKCQETFAWGLRNPFRFAFDSNAHEAGETRFFINDVGAGTWEEINEGIMGADFGWHIREGNCVTDSTTDCGAPPAGMTNPIYAYDHATGCTSITGGAFVPNGVWPEMYNNGYLYGDWICDTIFLLKEEGGVYTSEPFIGEGSGIIWIGFGPDDALYYLTYGTPYTTGLPGQLRRVTYTGSSNRAPTAVLSAAPTSGDAPLEVNFDGSASSDPDAGDTLTYLWDFGDGSATSETAQATTSHTYATDGTYTATLHVRDQEGLTSAEGATVRIDVGNSPPQPTISSPAEDVPFRVDQTITMQGSATDAEDGDLPASALTWEVRRHHNTHFHPYVEPTPGNNISFTAPPPEDLLPGTVGYLEILLTATDSNGATQTVSRFIYPNIVTLSFETNPPGLPLTLDGMPRTGPTTIDSWEGYALPVEAPESVQHEGQIWRFAGWSDDGEASHFVDTPAAPATFTANYEVTNDVIFADGFEGANFSAWTNVSSDAGDLSLSTAAAMVETQGLSVLMDDNTPIGMRDEVPASESRYRARFYLDPNDVAMGSGEHHVIFFGYSGDDLRRPVLRLEMRKSGSDYAIRAALFNDDTVWRISDWQQFSNAPHIIELDWRAATGVGANNGSLDLWIDEVLRASIFGVDNDTRRIDTIRLGAIAGIDNGTRGTTYFDAFESRRLTYIGPAATVSVAMAEAAAVSSPTEIYAWTDVDESEPEEAALMREVLEEAERIENEENQENPDDDPNDGEQVGGNLFLPFIEHPAGE